MANDYLEDEAAVEEMHREDFNKLLGSRELSPGVTEHVTYSNSEAYNIIRDAAEHDARVVISMRDDASDTKIEIFANEGHSVGASASWLMDEVIGSRSSIAEDIAAYSHYGEITDPDGWLIEVHTNWREG